ncbi:MAG TPA: hypothetical protein VF233_03990 [Nitrososphaeraceae archaeon]
MEFNTAYLVNLIQILQVFKLLPLRLSKVSEPQEILTITPAARRSEGVPNIKERG